MFALLLRRLCFRMLVCFTFFLITVCMVPCSYSYTYYILEDLCASNKTEIRLAEGNNSGLILQAYVNTWSHPELTECSLAVTAKIEDGFAFCIPFTNFSNGCEVGVHTLTFTSDSFVLIFCDKVRRFKPMRFLENCFKVDQPSLNINYSATADGVRPQFRLVINTFRKVVNKTKCHESEFTCGNNEMCIWPGFICDGYNNCLDNSDESLEWFHKPCIDGEKWLWIVILGLLPLVIVSACCICTWNNFKRAHHEAGSQTEGPFLIFCQSLMCTAATSRSIRDVPFQWFCNMCRIRSAHSEHYGSARTPAITIEGERPSIERTSPTPEFTP